MDKIVDFEKYCRKCIHRELDWYKHPCYDCLSVPARQDQIEQPVYFKEKQKR